MNVGIFNDLANRLKGSECKKLIRYDVNTITLGGANIGMNDFSFDISRFLPKSAELTNARELAIHLDDLQYLLCKEAMGTNDSELRTQIKKIRLMLILGLSQLQAILQTMKSEPNADLTKELTEWLRYMNELSRISISSLAPGPKLVSKRGINENKIMEYEGVDTSEIQELNKIHETE